MQVRGRRIGWLARVIVVGGLLLGQGKVVMAGVGDPCAVNNCACPLSPSYPCPSPTPDPGSGGDSSCGNAAYPACSGVCESGTVCRANEGNRACKCGTINSCDSIISQPPDPRPTRLSSTAVHIWWRMAPTTSYVSELTLTVEPMYNNEAQTYTYVFDPRVVGGTDVLGLSEGTLYTITTRYRAAEAEGAYSNCAKHSNALYLSSCLLTPNPLDVTVGQDLSMSTGLASGKRSLFDSSTPLGWRVSYTSSDRTVATVTNPASDPDTFRPYNTTVTGVADGVATIETTVKTWSPTSDVFCTDTALVNVGDVPTPPPGTDAAWWQVVGGGVYAGSSAGGLAIRSEVPAGQYFLVPGTVGSVAALMRASGTYETGNGSLSISAWNALTRYRGKRMDYGFFAAQLGVVPDQANDFAAEAMEQPVYDSGKDFYYLNPASGTASLASPWDVGAGEQYVVFVDGNLDINQNVTVASGGYLMWVVSGDVTIDPAVTTLQGLLVVNGVVTTETVGGGGDSQLIVAGTVVAWDGMSLNRDLGSAGNSAPAEQFVYRPDLLVSMPEKVKVFVMEWQEVAPGTFGN